MKVVIDIPDIIMETKQYVDYFGCVSEKLIKIIENGTRIPDKHGRLIDVNEYFSGYFNDAREFLDKATTIVDADA